MLAICVFHHYCGAVQCCTKDKEACIKDVAPAYDAIVRFDPKSKDQHTSVHEQAAVKVVTHVVAAARKRLPGTKLTEAGRKMLKLCPDAPETPCTVKEVTASSDKSDL